MKDELFMSTTEVASLLGLPAEQVRRDAEAGRLPGQHDSNHWRFPRHQLLHWMQAASQTSSPLAVGNTEDQTGVFAITESRDLDHYHAQPGNWNVRVNQLSSGDFLSRVRAIRLPGLTVYDNRWARAALVQGQSPSNMVMLGADVQTEGSRISWCGATMNAARYACTDAGGGIDFLLPEGAHDVVFLLDPELFCQVAGQSNFALLSASKHLDVDPAAGEQLVRLVLALLSDCETRSLLLELPSVAAQVRSTILAALQRIFVVPQATDCRLGCAAREQAVHMGIQLASELRGHISALDMAAAIGVSQRTLEYAFRQVLGITPGRYLQLTRLNGIHHELANDDGHEGGVTEMALKWGFSHHGRFCAAYRGLFGELPSDTRRRSQSTASISSAC